MDREFWSSFSHDPRDGQVQSMRASDQDRAVVQQALSDAYADGRLDREELDERTDQTTRSRTLGELVPIVSDLVAATPPSPAGSRLATATPAELHQRAVDKYASERREAVFGFLFATLVTTVIWFLATRDTLFWPGFVALGTGLNVVKTVSRKREIIAAEERKLERKRAKEQGLPWKPDDRSSE